MPRKGDNKEGEIRGRRRGQRGEGGRARRGGSGKETRRGVSQIQARIRARRQAGQARGQNIGQVQSVKQGRGGNREG